MKGEKMKSKLKSKTITTRWEYDDKTIIHQKVRRQPDLVYFSGSSDITNWDNANGYIDIAPKGKFITRFKDRVKRFGELLKKYV